ncbi:MAG: hypothetical protein K2Q32_09315 [Alphaproteobacteria bacterium]|nr:hypothetical protein [Alphaproteobacteria bacterium]
MSVYIYLFQDRIIHWAPQSIYSKPAGIDKIAWYSIAGSIPMPLNDMVSKGNVGYNSLKGFYTVDGEPGNGWEERAKYVKQIQIIDAFNSIANTQKTRYTDNSIGQSLTDVLILDEIRQFRATNSLADCTILTSLNETGESELTPEAMVTKLWLRYESFRTVLSYLNRLEFNIRTLFNQNKLEEAQDLVNIELEKMRI